jgi:hypothetical protein
MSKDVSYDVGGDVTGERATLEYNDGKNKQFSQIIISGY